MGVEIDLILIAAACLCTFAMPRRKITTVQTVRAEGMKIPPLAIHAVPNGEKAVEALPADDANLLTLMPLPCRNSQPKAGAIQVVLNLAQIGYAFSAGL